MSTPASCDSSCEQTWLQLIIEEQQNPKTFLLYFHLSRYMHFLPLLSATKRQSSPHTSNCYTAFPFSIILQEWPSPFFPKWLVTKKKKIIHHQEWLGKAPEDITGVCVVALGTIETCLLPLRQGLVTRALTQTISPRFLLTAFHMSRAAGKAINLWKVNI